METRAKWGGRRAGKQDDIKTAHKELIMVVAEMVRLFPFKYLLGRSQ